MKRHRIERHETLIHQVINEYLIREGKSFLKKEFVTIMGIKLSPDLSIALIYIILHYIVLHPMMLLLM